MFPAARGSVVTVQRHTSKGWRRLRRVRIGANGSYALAIASPGSYRVLYAGVGGPAVTLR